VVGGACAVAAFIFPDWVGSAFLFKMSFMAYASMLMNLNPLLA